MRAALTALFGLGALAGTLALIGGVLGAWHPAGDSLAVFRAELAVVTLVPALGLAALGRRRAAAVPAAAALVALGLLVPHWLPGGGARAEAAGPGVVVYQKNLWRGRADMAALAADIHASGADLVALQEVGPGAQPLFPGNAVPVGQFVVTDSISFRD